MLVKIKEFTYLNADYVLMLMLLPPGLIDVKGKDLPSVTTWKIAARMLDGSTQLLLEFSNEEEAKKEYASLIHEANKRVKHIEYTGE